ncbi:MAG: class II histone deacetylase [Thermomicrobiales bacterium]|nr:class II histone deacetylase [Thermomicrobiales bacterium]MCO5222602.1 class II histone deacetylase [Thermomicrobiales bacterium]
MTRATTKTVGLVFDDRYLAHDTGLSMIEDSVPWPFPTPVPHPSSPELVGRAKHLMDLGGVTDLMTRIEPYEADNAALLRFHTQDYLSRLAVLDRTGGETGSGAPMGIGGLRIARLSAGGVMAATDAVMTGAARHVYALVRPPGHHAMPHEGMGFCVLNNVAIAARHAQANHGVRRIAIVDWDVHHGNGTQTAFYADPDVLFISLHQDSLYPFGYGNVDQVGDGAGEGRTVNIPLPSGSGNATYRAAFERVVVPVIDEFAPDLIFVSAGQDASVFDPLARMTLTTSAYRAMAGIMLDLAEQSCDGRLVVAQEGGYAPQYAPFCSASIAETLTGRGSGVMPLFEPYGDYDSSIPSNERVGLDAEQALQAVREAQASYWTSLR